MATITKLPTGKFKAIIRRGRCARSRIYTQKTNAKAWVKRFETNQEAMGLAGASMTRSERAEKYFAQCSGRNAPIGFKVRCWQENAYCKLESLAGIDNWSLPSS